MPENKVQITIEAIDKAKDALTGLAKDLKGIGDAGKGTTQSLSGMGALLAGLKANWVGLSIGINQALEIFGKIKGATEAIYNFAKEGQKVVLTETAFKHMAQSVGADADGMASRLKAATKGLVDDTDLMRRATDLMLAGVKPDKVEALTQAMMKLAPYAGMTLPEGMDRLSAALESGNARAIRSIIGYVDLNHELDVYAQKLGKTADQLTDTARVQASAQIILEKMRGKTKDLTDTHELGINTFQRFETAWKNMIEEMQKGVGPLGTLVEWFTKLIEKVNEYGRHQEKIKAEAEARKEFAATPLGEAMLGAIGTKKGQGYEAAFQQWYADQMKKKDYQALAAAAAADEKAAGGGKKEEGPFKKPDELQTLQKELALIQSINDEETKRKLSLDKQVEIMLMQTAGMTKEEAALFKANSLRQIENEFGAKRLNAQSGIAKAEAEREKTQGDLLKSLELGVRSLELQRDAELMLATNGQQRLDLAKKWNLEIDKARTAGAAELIKQEAEIARGLYGLPEPGDIEKANQRRLGRFEAQKAYYEGLPTLEESTEQTREKIRAQADAYKELYETTGKGAKEWVFYRKMLLDDELKDLKQKGLDEETLEKFRVQRIKQINVDAGYEMRDVWTGIASNMNSAMESGFFDLFKNGVVNLGSAFRGFCENMVNSWYRALSQMASNLTMFGDISGSRGINSGGLFGLVRSFFGASEIPAGQTPSSMPDVYYGHQGSHGVIRMVPRLHMGLKPDEFPAILQTGERVLSRAEVAAGANNAPGVVINVENKTGAQVRARQTGLEFDGKNWVKNITLELMQSDPDWRFAMGMRGE